MKVTDSTQSSKRNQEKATDIQYSPCAFCLPPLRKAEPTSSTGFQYALRPGKGEREEEEKRAEEVDCWGNKTVFWSAHCRQPLYFYLHQAELLDGSLKYHCTEISLGWDNIINLPWRNRGKSMKLPFAYTQIQSFFTGGLAGNDKKKKKWMDGGNNQFK